MDSASLCLEYRLMRVYPYRHDHCPLFILPLVLRDAGSGVLARSLNHENPTPLNAHRRGVGVSGGCQTRLTTPPVHAALRSETATFKHRGCANATEALWSCSLRGAVSAYVALPVLQGLALDRHPSGPCGSCVGSIASSQDKYETRKHFCGWLFCQPVFCFNSVLSTLNSSVAN